MPRQVREASHVRKKPAIRKQASIVKTTQWPRAAEVQNHAPVPRPLAIGREAVSVRRHTVCASRQPLDDKRPIGCRRRLPAETAVTITIDGSDRRADDHCTRCIRHLASQRSLACAAAGLREGRRSERHHRDHHDGDQP
jgi:hypothetical protein